MEVLDQQGPHPTRDRMDDRRTPPAVSVKASAGLLQGSKVGYVVELD